MGSDGIYGGKAKSKRCVFRYFLKVATELAEQTDSGRLFQRDETGYKSENKYKVNIFISGSNCQSQDILPGFVYIDICHATPVM